MRLVPNRSPIQPDAGIHTASDRRYPRTIHSMSATDTPNSRPRVGSATFTLVVSRMSMNVPATNTIATIHL